MSTLDSLRRELNRYYNLKDSITQTMKFIASSIDKIELASSRIDCYSIDGVSADNSVVLNNKNELIDKRNEINGKIIPEINAQIYSLRRKIQEEEARLAAMMVI